MLQDGGGTEDCSLLKIQQREGNTEWSRDQTVTSRGEVVIQIVTECLLGVGQLWALRRDGERPVSEQEVRMGSASGQVKYQTSKGIVTGFAPGRETVHVGDLPWGGGGPFRAAA